VRGKPGQQRRCLAVLPGRGVEQREPLHDESPDELGQGREDVEDQPAAQGGGVFADKQSGKTAGRPELAGCLDYLRLGDTLVVPSLDRLSRSLQDLIAFVAGLRRRGTGFRSVHEALADAAGLGQGAGLPVQVLPGRGHAGVPDQRVGQVRRLGASGSSSSATARPTGVSITPQPDGKRQYRSCQALRLLNTFFRHSPPAEN